MWLGKYVIRYIYLKFNNLRKGDDVIHIFFNHLKDMVMSGYEEGDDCLTILPVGNVVVENNLVGTVSVITRSS